MIEQTRRRTWRWEPALVVLAHALAVAWMFAGPLFTGRVPFFRDIPVYYFPNYVFLARSLEAGVFPLWNPHVDGGGPFLLADPVEVALVATLGPTGALRLSPPAHVFIAMLGASLLARQVGWRWDAAWTAGVVYGLSGLVQAMSNLFEHFHAVCWAPAVIAALAAVAAAPGGRMVATAAVLMAVQTATLSGEVVLMTLGAAVLVVPGLLRRPALPRLAAAGMIAALLTAPVLLASRDLLAGTRRAAGFEVQTVLAWSASPMVLAEALVPRLFGDVHTFSDRGFWGQPFFSGRYPYLLSLYLGPVVAVLAAHGRARRLWILACAGLLLALGAYGPARVLHLFSDALRLPFRTPVKAFFLCTLAASLLAAEAVERLRQGGGRVRAWAIVPGALFVLWAAVQWHHPAATASLLGAAVPALWSPDALEVARDLWPGFLARSGALAVAAALLLKLRPTLAVGAAVLAALDLAGTNGAINLSTEPWFYDLRAPVRALVERARAADPPAAPHRWFSYGVSGSTGLRWNPGIVARNSDVWLFYLDRQSLLPRSHVLDGLSGAYDEDRTGFSPPSSTLHPAARRTMAFRAIHSRLRLAGVRWVVGYDPLPDDLVELVATARQPEIAQPLRLHALRAPLPRAFWVPRHEVVRDRKALEVTLARGPFDPRRAVLLEEDPASASGTGEGTDEAVVSYEGAGPHAVRLRASTPPGFIVVLDGWHRQWRAERDGSPVPVMRANSRYWAIPTPGGEHVFTVRYRPTWLVPTLVLSAGGWALVVGLAAWGRGRGGGGPHPRRSAPPTP